MNRRCCVPSMSWSGLCELIHHHHNPIGWHCWCHLILQMRKLSHRDISNLSMISQERNNRVRMKPGHWGPRGHALPFTAVHIVWGRRWGQGSAMGPSFFLLLDTLILWSRWTCQWTCRNSVREDLACANFLSQLLIHDMEITVISLPHHGMLNSEWDKVSVLAWLNVYFLRNP